MSQSRYRLAILIAIPLFAVGAFFLAARLNALSRIRTTEFMSPRGENSIVVQHYPAQLLADHKTDCYLRDCSTGNLQLLSSLPDLVFVDVNWHNEDDVEITHFVSKYQTREGYLSGIDLSKEYAGLKVSQEFVEVKSFEIAKKLENQKYQAAIVHAKASEDSKVVAFTAVAVLSMGKGQPTWAYERPIILSRLVNYKGNANIDINFSAEDTISIVENCELDPPMTIVAYSAYLQSLQVRLTRFGTVHKPEIVFGPK